MADGLAGGFLGTTVVAGRPRGVVDKGGGPLLGEGGAELEVALLGVAEGSGSLDRPQAKALAGDEHGEFASDLIVGVKGQGAVRAKELAELAVESEHGGTSSEEGRGSDWGKE